jgi:hypothetical protein
MNYPKYAYQSGDIDIQGQTCWKKEDARKLAHEIFESWCEILPKVDTQNQQRSLKARVFQHTEGQSSAEVYELSLRENLQNAKPVAKFILKVFLGEDADDKAKDEFNFAKSISQTSTAADYFSSTVVDAPPSFPNVVVYRHADDEVGEETQSLRDYALHALELKNIDTVKRLSEDLEKLSNAVTRAYDEVGGPHTVSQCEHYFNTIVHKLTPDLVINAVDRAVAVKPSEGSDKIDIWIPTGDGTAPMNLNNVHAVSLEELWNTLSEGKESSSRWLRVDVSAERLNLGRGGYLKFKSDDRRIWLQIDGNTFQEPLDEYKSYQLIFEYDDELVTLGTKQLEKRGFDKDPTLSPNDLRGIFQSLNPLIPRLARALRHTDLHCRNILSTSNRLKIIDLSSTDIDLLAVAQSRLEMSIWDGVTKEILLDTEETEKILEHLSADKDPPDDLSFEAKAIYSILIPLRRSITKQNIPENEVTLAYATQALLYQRYHIEQLNEASEAFVVVANYWLKRLIQLANNADFADRPEQITDETIPSYLSTTGDEPTLHMLWQYALQSPSLLYTEQRAEEFLQTLEQNQPNLTRWVLTELQQTIWDEYQKPNQEPQDHSYALVGNDQAELRPFQSNRHVIIAAPTSSGKSTIAEMFLAGPPLLNQQRTCSLYIAPTRALTQAKYRELKGRFADDKIQETIVLSTGEDTDDDWRINHGNFSIACMVYETANILFSRNRKLLNLLGCIVIDEMHMLSDLERGPILEMVLTKILHERGKVDAQTTRSGNETIRIIAISTEDRPDKANEDFLSVLDMNTSKSLPPLIFHAPERPVEVQHNLVLPGNQTQDYTVFPLVKFTSSEDRTLSPPLVKEIDKKLHKAYQKIPRPIPHARYEPKYDEHTRLNLLLRERLDELPRGHRILVFIPSRHDLENQAQRLRNRLLEDSPKLKIENSEILTRLTPHLDRAEDLKTAKVVKRCAEAGVLLHHSDINRKIRAEVEDICSTIDPHTPSQVIFATETLSYGVNLAVHDVVLVGTQFHTQSRHRQPRLENLSICAYHNMAGRAGRLGKTPKNKTGQVYAIVPHDSSETNQGFNIVKNYYLKVDPAQSTLYVTDDRNVQLAAEQNAFLQLLTLSNQEDECAKYASLDAGKFSYPFVRSVLDALRHLNTTELQSASDSKTPTTLDNLLELLNRSLYTRQSIKSDGNVPNRKEATLFLCAVCRILDDCARAALHLVEVNKGTPKLYTITPRGEAIIDTGTEIHTIEPLLNIVEAFHDVWNDVYPNHTFPTDLYVLGILAQNEVFRQYIGYTPECRNHNWRTSVAEMNREKVFRLFATALKKIGLPDDDKAESLAAKLRSCLDQWNPLREHNSGYDNGSADSILRFFNGIIAWINGEDRAVIDRLIEGDDNDQYKGSMRGFRQFTELLQIKTVFLARMLATDKGRKVQPDDERNLHMLASRLRLGCTSQGIPLFWPTGSDFRRREAANLLGAGYTPSRLLPMADPDKIDLTALGVNSKQLSQLQQDLRRFAAKELDNLQFEMTVVQTSNPKREAINKGLWPRLKDRFEQSLEQYRSTGDECTNFDALLREVLDFTNLLDENGEQMTPILDPVNRLNDQYRIRIHVEPPSGLLWQGEKRKEITDIESKDEQRQYHYVKDCKVKVIGVQFRRHWEANPGSNPREWRPFINLLEDDEHIQHLVIVSLPWIPLATEMSEDLHQFLQNRADRPEYSTTIITPAAFGVMVTSIVRDFVTSEVCMKMLAKTSPKNHPWFNFIAVKDVLEAIEQMPDPQIPPTIRETLLRHFEVTV